MNVNFVVLLHSHSRYTFHSCSDGSSAWKHTLACSEALTHAGVVQACTLLYVDSSKKSDTDSIKNLYTDRYIGFTEKYRISNSLDSLVVKLCDIAQDNTHICLMFADSMISYEPLYTKMIETHRKYASHYTRSEGYPESVTPEIFSPNACKMLSYTLSELKTNAKITEYSSPITRGALFSLVEKRINDYDIEAVLAPQDMRMLRVSLSADTRTNFTLSKQLWDSGLRNPDDLLLLYEDKPQLFRSLPRYVYIQLTDAVHPTIYDPHYFIMHSSDKESGEITQRRACKSMRGDVWNAIISKLTEDAEDAILALGFAGEVALHPDVFSFMSEASEAFSAVYVETNGYEWDTTSSWWNMVPSNISWIVYLDAHNTEVYKNVHKSSDCGGLSAQEAYTKAHSFVEMLIEKATARNVFVQATRMVENESDLDAFCKYWDGKGAQPIIQKYNNVCGMLPDKKNR